MNDTKSETRSKAIKYASGIGATGLVAALLAISHGEAVDCSVKAQCVRTIELSGSEYECTQKYTPTCRPKCFSFFPKAGDESKRQACEDACKPSELAPPKEQTECVETIAAGWRETRDACGDKALKVKDYGRLCRPWAGLDENGTPKVINASTEAPSAVDGGK